MLCSDDGIVSETGNIGDAAASLLVTADAKDDNEDDVAVSCKILAGRRTRERHSICGNPMHMAPEMLQPTADEDSKLQGMES